MDRQTALKAGQTALQPMDRQHWRLWTDSTDDYGQTALKTMDRQTTLKAMDREQFRLCTDRQHCRLWTDSTENVALSEWWTWKLTVGSSSPSPPDAWNQMGSAQAVCLLCWSLLSSPSELGKYWWLMVLGLPLSLEGNRSSKITSHHQTLRYVIF